MNKNNFKQRKKVGDYVLTCDTCGQLFWASRRTILDKYTGKGGACVCSTCVDKIDYGLVPYTVLPEDVIPISRNSNYQANPSDIPNTIDPTNLDFTTIDPMSINKPTTDPRLT